jgi:hypothetical protein
MGKNPPSDATIRSLYEKDFVVIGQCNGMPREIISDRDTIFTAKLWCHLM